MQIIRIAPPNPSRNRVRMKAGKEVENAPTTTAQISRQDRETVRLGAQLQKNPGGDKVSQNFGRGDGVVDRGGNGIHAEFLGHVRCERWTQPSRRH